MSRRHGLLAGVVGILLMGSGCVSCGATGYGLAREAAPECEAECCQRNHVYVFAVSGVNPLEIMALDTFREQLNRKGYAKVATGQTIHAIWMAGEMRRIRASEPDAAFVLVGTTGAATTTRWLAKKLAADGGNVAGVVLFNRRGDSNSTIDGTRFFTITDKPVSSDESVAVVTQLLNEVAATTARPIVIEMMESDYPHAPEPRPLIGPGDSPEWAFLFDQGIPTQSMTMPVLVAKPATQPNTTAARK